MPTKRKAPGRGDAGQNGAPGSKRKVRFRKKEESEGDTAAVHRSKLKILILRFGLALLSALLNCLLLQNATSTGV